MKHLLSIAAVTAIVAGPAFAEAPIAYDKALSCVQEHVPATSYVTNDLVPSDADLGDITPLAETQKLRVGLS